uniref:Transmembrane protein n=1 Tax=Thermus tengchongensis TaxID=1214928 RepID=A0A7V4E5N4_9DEIN
MWWINVFGVLGLAAVISGQREAVLLLLLWITWPLLSQAIQNLRSRDNSRREKEKEEVEEVEVVEGEIVYSEAPRQARGELPHSTRPALPDPDVVEVEFKELLPPSTPKWQKAVAYVFYAIGLFFIATGALVLIASVLSVLR